MKLSFDKRDMTPVNYETDRVVETGPGHQMNPEECPGMCGGKAACVRQNQDCM